MQLTTVANVIDELQIDSSRSAFITRLIKQATGMIEKHCARTFARATQTDIVPVRRSVRFFPRLVLPRAPIIGTPTIAYTDLGVSLSSSLWSVDDAAGGVLYRADGWAGLPTFTAPSSGAYFDDVQAQETRYSVTYEAGFDDPSGAAGSPPSTIPDDLERACINTVKELWFAATRDPRIKSEAVDGIGRADYWIGGMPDGSDSGLSAATVGILSPYQRIVL